MCAHVSDLIWLTMCKTCTNIHLYGNPLCPGVQSLWRLAIMVDINSVGNNIVVSVPLVRQTWMLGHPRDEIMAWKRCLHDWHFMRGQRLIPLTKGQSSDTIKREVCLYFLVCDTDLRSSMYILYILPYISCFEQQQEHQWKLIDKFVNITCSCTNVSWGYGRVLDCFTWFLTMFTYVPIAYNITAIHLMWLHIDYVDVK